ncbi:hypothetical protein BH11PSE7_BH11PSE7_37920 [soil metagenome]
MLKQLFTAGSCERRENERVPSFNHSSVTTAHNAVCAARRIAAAWRWAGVALVLAAVALPPARAGDDGGQERARQAVASGQILPLDEVLERVQKSYPGKVMEVEFEGKHGLWIYEVRLLQANGRLIKLKLNAKTAEVIRSMP